MQIVTQTHFDKKYIFCTMYVLVHVALLRLEDNSLFMLSFNGYCLEGMWVCVYAFVILLFGAWILIKALLHSNQ